MTDSFFKDALLNSVAASRSNRQLTPLQILRLLAFFMAGLTVFLMALGSATRVMNAGLSCPDWPLCYGQLVPSQQMSLQVFLEWFHRLVASSLGLLALGLTGLSWWWRQRLPLWTPWLASFCLVLILVQGLLGGLTVTQLLRFDIVTAHLGTGLLVFCALLTIGLLLLPYKSLGSVGKLPWLAALAVGLVYLQSLLGALVSSQWAVHQCLGNSQLCAVMHSHLLGVVPASLSTLFLGIWAWRQPALHPWLRQSAKTALLILGLQVGLGISTLHLKLQVPYVTVAHQVIGALLLGLLLTFTVLAFRDWAQFNSPEDKSLCLGTESL